MASIVITLPDDTADATFERVRRVLCDCDEYHDKCEWRMAMHKGAELLDRVERLEELIRENVPCPDMLDGAKCWGGWGHSGQHWTVEGPGLGTNIRW